MSAREGGNGVREEGKKETPRFEEGLARLEEIVRRIEAEDVPLEEMLKLYEEGSHLHRRLEETLEKAKLRIETLEGEGDEGPDEEDEF